MSKGTLNTLQAAIQANALEDFKSLPASDALATPTARFHWYPEKDRPAALIKVFHGETAGELYRQEITALYGLRSTGRVCLVVCDSNRHDPRFWNESFRGPYFIAKQYYHKSLKPALSTTTAFEKLDIAAQEIDIARLFLAEGWRDYDWRIENDVIGDDGRVLRVDLDSASALSTVFGEKSTLGNPKFFSIKEAEVLETLLRLREEIVKSSQRNEVRNLAIRFSFHIFVDDNEVSDLVRLVRNIQVSEARHPNSGDGAAKYPFGPMPENRDSLPKSNHPIERISEILERATAALIKPGGALGSAERDASHALVARESSNLTQETGSRENRISLLDEWIDVWLRQASYRFDSRQMTPQALAQLTPDEWGVLARLFYHLISTSEHGFSLDDFHGSLLMLAASFLHVRKHRLTQGGSTGPAMVKCFAPNTEFYELRRTLAPTPSVAAPERSPVVGEAYKRARVAKSIPPPVRSRAYTQDCGYWPGKKSGGTGEDRAFVFSTDSLLFAAVSDGVSEAHGAEAAVIVAKGLQESSKQLSATSRAEAKAQLRSIVCKINNSLIDAFKKTAEPHQATLVMALVGKEGESFFASMAQAGNSNCVVFSPDGSTRFSTDSWRTRQLGTAEDLTEEDMMFKDISLGATGADQVYRIRLYSDGIGEGAYERIRGVQKVEDLVIEAASWPEALDGSVGFDDWSIAGFDISVIEKPSEPVLELLQGDARPVEEQSVPASDGFSLLSFIDGVDSATIKLSDRAKEFWRETISSLGDRDAATASLGFVREVVGHPKPAVADSGKSFYRETAEAGGSKTTRFSAHKRLFLVGGAILFILVVAIIYFLNAPSKNEQSGDQKTEKTTPSPEGGAVSDPTFPFEVQKRIYLALKEKKPFVRDRLPGREALQQPHILFLNDLAEVLRRTKYDITLEVFSAPGGSAEENQGITNRRAINIQRHLVSVQNVPQGQVEVVGNGQWDNKPMESNRELTEGIDTSGAIFLIRRRR